MRIDVVFSTIVLCFFKVTEHAVDATDLTKKNGKDHFPPNPQRLLSLSFGSGALTRAPSSAPPDSVTASTNFTFFLYTELPSDQINLPLSEVHTYVQTRLEAAFAELQGDVRLTLMRDQRLTEECPSTLPDTVPPGYTTCAMYRTFIEATMKQYWHEHVLERTSMQVVRTYLDAYNNQTSKSAFVVFNDPIPVRAEFSLLLVGARQPMSFYEHSFMASALLVSDLDKKGLTNENPPFTIFDIKYMWQRVVSRLGPTKEDEEGGLESLDIELVTG